MNSSNTNKIIGLYGGTFDPIHNGHLHIANEVLTHLKLDHIEFIPCGCPSHRNTPLASAKDRAAMVKLAIQAVPQFKLNLFEVETGGPSFAINTVKALANEQETHIFIIGIDSFLKFDQWHQWQSFLDYCHLLVINRPHFEFQLNKTLQNWYQKHAANNIEALHHNRNGLIALQHVKPIDLSSTKIRQAIATQKTPKNLPKNVANYIKTHHLYQKVSDPH